MVYFQDILGLSFVVSPKNIPTSLFCSNKLLTLFWPKCSIAWVSIIIVYFRKYIIPFVLKIFTNLIMSNWMFWLVDGMNCIHIFFHECLWVFHIWGSLEEYFLKLISFESLLLLPTRLMSENVLFFIMYYISMYVKIDKYNMIK